MLFNKTWLNFIAVGILIIFLIYFITQSFNSPKNIIEGLELNFGKDKDKKRRKKRRKRKSDDDDEEYNSDIDNTLDDAIYNLDDSIYEIQKNVNFDDNKDKIKEYLEKMKEYGHWLVMEMLVSYANNTSEPSTALQTILLSGDLDATIDEVFSTKNKVKGSGLFD